MNRVICLLTIAICCIFSYVVDAQNNNYPGGVPGALAWFVTERDAINPQKGTWVDHSQYSIELEVYDNDVLVTPYSSDLRSVNFNPGFYFDDSNTHYRFQTKKSLKRHHTIIGVLIPDQSGDMVQWALYEDENISISALGTDNYYPSSPNVTPYDYGDLLNEEFSSDIMIGNGEEIDESDRWGKIVTTNVYSRADFCWDVEELHKKLFEVYSISQGLSTQQEGVVPEFIVFDRIITEKERAAVETYLAIKYGMSKYYDYESASNSILWDAEGSGNCEKEYVELGQSFNYYNRMTGIGATDPYLNQSRSTSYYDEGVSLSERQMIIEELSSSKEEDFSHHRKRSVTIGIEDESSDLRSRWGNGSYLIWGDNNVDLNEDLIAKTLKGEELELIPRVWMAELKASGSASNPNGICWGNFINLSNEQGIISRKFQEESTNDRDGVMATTTSVPSDGVAILEFQVEVVANSGDFALIGFSKNHSNFVGMNNDVADDCQDFVLAVELKGSQARIRYDDMDDDGFFDSQAGPYNYASNQDIQIKVALTGVEYQFDIYINQNLVKSVAISTEKTVPLYGKAIFTSDQIELSGFKGTGFEAQDLRRTNVEISYDKFQGVFPDADKGQDIVYMIVNEDGDRSFPDNLATKCYQGVYSKTPNFSQNKIEFYGIPWEESGCNVFTFGLKECDQELVIGQPEPDCCGEGVWYPVSITGCQIPGDFEICYDYEFEEYCILYNMLNPQDEFIYVQEDILNLEITVTRPDGSEFTEFISGPDDNDGPFDLLDLLSDMYCFNSQDDLIIDLTSQLNALEQNIGPFVFTWRLGINGTPSNDYIITIPWEMDIMETLIIEIFLSCPGPNTLDGPTISCEFTEMATIEDCFEPPCLVTVEELPCDILEVCLFNIDPDCRDPYTFIISHNNGPDIGPFSLNEQSGDYCEVVDLSGISGEIEIIFTTPNNQSCCTPDDITMTLQGFQLQCEWAAGNTLYICGTNDGELIILDPSECLPDNFENGIGCQVVYTWTSNDVILDQGDIQTVNPNDVNCNGTLTLQIDITCQGQSCPLGSFNIFIHDCTDPDPCQHPIGCPCSPGLLGFEVDQCTGETGSSQILVYKLDESNSDPVEVDLWTSFKGQRLNLVTSAIISGPEILELAVPNEGDYVLSYTQYEYEASEIVSVSYQNYLPSEIIEDQVEVTLGESYHIDLLAALPDGLLIQWHGSDGFFSEKYTEDLLPGKYELRVSNEVCQVIDSIEVIETKNPTIKKISSKTTRIHEIIYTNPIAKDREYRFKALSEEALSLEVQVLRSDGVLFHREAIAPNLEQELRIELPTGLYFMQFKWPDYSETLRIVVH